jgi:DNA-binding response OmpR family regulator
MKKILVVEDDQALQQLISDVLENESYKVFSALNGKAGIELAKEILPDLIICDIMMPGVDGYQVKSILSDDPSTVLIPFIYLSALVDKKNIRQGMELGADDYITKPFKIDELVNAVKVRFKKQELLEEMKQKEKSQDERNSPEKIDEEGLVILEVNGEPRLVKVRNISCITAYSEYSYVFNNNEKIMVRRLLKNWEEILPEKIFFRIHRSTIINLNYIDKVEKWFNNSFAVFLKNFNEPFIVSRRYSTHLKSKLHYK